jgi:hypothetical protein
MLVGVESHNFIIERIILLAQNLKKQFLNDKQKRMEGCFVEIKVSSLKQAML